MSITQMQERTTRNKNQLNEYLADFNPIVVGDYIELFNEEDFNCGYLS